MAEYTLVAGPRKLLSCVDWMLEHKEPVDDRIWSQVYALSQSARAPRTRLMAARIMADRFDPIPRAPALQVDVGPVSLTWSPGASLSPMPLGPSSSASTTSSSLDALALPSSSATDDLASL